MMDGPELVRVAVPPMLATCVVSLIVWVTPDDLVGALPSGQLVCATA